MDARPTHRPETGNPGSDRTASADAEGVCSREFFRVRGRELEDLLYPVMPQQFVRDYWTREPLYIKGPSHKFAGLFDIAAFHAAARRAGAIHVEFKGGLRLRKAQPEDIDIYFRQGATICLTDIGNAGGPLQTIVDAIKTQLHFSGTLDLRSYLSSNGCGYATHADARIATTLQISGRKRWRFTRYAAVKFPLHSIVPTAEGYRVHREGPPAPWEHFDAPDETTFSEVILEPGDLLCLPAGTWHSAEAIGHSLAINMAFNSPSFDTLITSALRERLLAMPEWRCPVPPAPGWHSQGDVPAHVAIFFAARLREMKDCIAALAPEGPELAHAWRGGVYCRTPSATETAPSTPSSSRIDPDDRFVRDSFTGFGWSLDAALCPALTVYAGTRSRSIRLSDGADAFIRKLMTVQSFTAEDCLCWRHNGPRYEWHDIEVILRALLEGGIIRREEPAS
jgi:ribosomal protein L16 Arg81 hydroxylase